MGAIARRDVIPEAITANREDKRRQHHGAAGNAALDQRHRKTEIARDLKARHFLFETPDGLVAIEAEMHGVGAHEALGIDRPGQAVIVAFLDRDQIGTTNA